MITRTDEQQEATASEGFDITCVALSLGWVPQDPLASPIPEDLSSSYTSRRRGKKNKGAESSSELALDRNTKKALKSQSKSTSKSSDDSRTEKSAGKGKKVVVLAAVSLVVLGVLSGAGLLLAKHASSTVQAAAGSPDATQSKVSSGAKSDTGTKQSTSSAADGTTAEAGKDTASGSTSTQTDAAAVVAAAPPVTVGGKSVTELRLSCDDLAQCEWKGKVTATLVSRKGQSLKLTGPVVTVVATDSTGQSVMAGPVVQGQGIVAYEPGTYNVRIYTNDHRVFAFTLKVS